MPEFLNIFSSSTAIHIMKYSTVITTLIATNIATALYIQDNHSILLSRSDKAVDTFPQPKGSDSSKSSQPWQRGSRKSSPNVSVRPNSPPREEQPLSPLKPQRFAFESPARLDADVADSIGGP